MRSSVWLVQGAVLVAITACQARTDSPAQQAGAPAVDPAAATAQIRTRSQELVVAERQKDVETAMRYWGDSAVLHMEGAPAVSGREAIKKAYADFFGAPMTFDSARIGAIRVASSGDLAYETGVNHFTMIDGKKKTPATGKYLAVWGRRSDGTWVVESIAVTNDKAATTH